MDLWFWLKLVLIAGPIILGTILSTLKIKKRTKILAWIICLLICICGVILLLNEKVEKEKKYQSTQFYQNLLERQELFSKHLPLSYVDGLGENPLLEHYFNEGKKYEKNFHFTKAIKQYQNCLSHPKATKENMVAANIAIGNCYYRASHLKDVDKNYETYKISKLEEAEKYYKYALNISKKVKDEDEKLEGRSTILLNISSVNHEMGKLEKALRYCKKSLRISKKIDHKVNIEFGLSRLGLIYMSLGKLDEALRYCKESLDISKEIGDATVTMGAFTSMGLVYYAMGNFDEAIQYFKEALNLNKKMGLFEEKSITGYLGIIGSSYHFLGKLDEAIKYFKEALAINRKAGYKRSTATNLNSIGSVYRDQGKFGEALRHFEEALKINRKIEDKETAATNLSNIGLIYMRNLEKYDEALRYFKEALNIDREIGLEYDTALNLSRIGLIYLELDNPDEALKCFKEALAICKSRKFDPVLEIMLEKVIEEEIGIN